MEYSFDITFNSSINFSNITKPASDLSDSENVIIAWSTASTLLTLFCFCIVFNLLSVSSIIWSKNFSPINILIMNLAVSDMIYSFSILIFLSHILNIFWIFTTITCKIFYLTDTVGMIVGVFTISALSIERFIEVADKKKQSYRYSSKFKVLVTLVYILVLWVSAICFSLPLVFSISVFKFKKMATCKSNWETGEENHLIRRYFIVKFILFFIFPYSLISVSSVRLLLFLNRWKKFLPEKSSKRHEDVKSKEKIDKRISWSLWKSKIINNNDTNESINLTGSITNHQNNASKLTNRKNSCIIINCSDSKANNRPALNKNSQVSSYCESTISNKKTNDETSVNKTGTHLRRYLERLAIRCSRSLETNEKVKTSKKSKNQRNLIRRKAIILVQMIVLLFFIQWIPLWVFQLIIEFSEKSIKHAEKINLITTILSYSNTVSNPVLYMFFTYNFKDFFRQIFKKK